MDAFERIFVCHPGYRVIICKRCKYAVNPAQINGHIIAEHCTVTKQQRQQIVNVVANLQDIARTPDEVRYPDISSAAVVGIPVFSDGLRCIAIHRDQPCHYVCRERRVMAIHCRTVHGWKNPRKGGGYRRADIPEETGQTWVEKQAYQQFFKTGKWKRYFPIQIVPEPEQAPMVNAIEQANTWIEGLFEQFEAARQQDQSERSRYEPNPWLEHTGWEKHIRTYKRWAVEQVQEDIVAAEHAEDPSVDADSETALKKACRGTIVLIRRSFNASRKEIVGRHALQCVHRRESGAPTSDRPFYSKQKVQTVRKYTAAFVKILRYIWRTEAIAIRPAYRLTPEQKQALVKLRCAARPPREPIASSPYDAPPSNQAGSEEPQVEREKIVDASLAFWIAMFQHPLGDSEYESGLLSGLAVLGACGEKNGWVPAIYYTPTLAGVITSVRAMVVRRAWRMREDYVAMQIGAGIDEAIARQGAPIIHELVQKDVEGFMTMTAFGGSPQPMNTIYTQKMYGMKIRYTTNADGQVGWSGEDHDVILVRKIQFSMGQVREVVHGLVDTARRRLVGELFDMDAGTEGWRPTALPPIRLDQIADNHAVADEGWSFFHDPRNQWPVDGRKWMGQRLVTDTRMRQRFGIDGTSIDMNPDAVEAYLRQVRRWKEGLLVLVHMSAGAPARATELISIQQVNGANARSHRGIFIDQGMVAFVTSYHKGFSASQEQKCVHRFVPYEVGELVVYYLWLVDPFVRLLQGSRGQMVFSPWMWEPAAEEEWADEEDEWVEEDEPGDPSVAASDVPDVPDHSAEAQFVERTTVEQAARNCDGFWETNRIRRVMRRESSKRIGVAIGPSDWRQAYPAIHREFAINRDIVPTLDRVYANANPHNTGPVNEEQTREMMRAKQSGHSPQMEETIYGRQLQQNPFSTRREQDAYREVSVDWHRFLQFPSSFEVKHVSPDVQRRMKQESEERKWHQWQQMRSVDIDGQLKNMYGPQACFRGKQREALELIISGHPRIVVVMRTGGGKSLLFQLPAAASVDGVTLVVMPKIMLQEDMAARCRKEGIRCAIWSDNHAPPFNAQVVFVIAESAVSQSFTDYVNAKMLNQQLERVFIDECHSVLQSTPQFRPKIAQLRDLIGRRVQVVCLTATLPPRREAAFLRVMDIEPGEVQIVRESTVRPNIAYRVVAYNSADEDAFVAATIQATLARYPSHDRIIVYCRTIVQMRHFAATIGGVIFHNKVGNIAKKRDIVAMLTSGEERLFWSTSALGEGIDAATVRVVIHVGVIDQLDDFAQQSGRSGRDGVTASESIVLRRFHVGQGGRVRFASSGKEESEMTAYLEGGCCRRIVLDRDMDGERARNGCQSGEQVCDVCRGHGKKRSRVAGEEAGEEVAANIGEGERVRQRRRIVDATAVEDQQQGQQYQRQVRQARRQVEQTAIAQAAAVRVQAAQVAVVRQEYQQQQRARQAVVQQRQQRYIRHADIIERLTQLFDVWQQGCSVCRVRGRRNQARGWRLCAHEDRARIEVAVDDGRVWLRRVRWQQAWAACQTCWAPRAVCHAWEAVHGQGPTQYERRQGGQCQYRGVLCEAVAIIMQYAGAEAILWIDRQAQTAGFDGDEGVVQYLGSTVKEGGVEMSGMCWFFHHYAMKHSEGGDMPVSEEEEEEEEEIREEAGEGGSVPDRWLFSGPTPFRERASEESPARVPSRRGVASRGWRAEAVFEVRQELHREDGEPKP